MNKITNSNNTNNITNITNIRNGVPARRPSKRQSRTDEIKTEKEREKEREKESDYELVLASTSHDMWSLGALFFYMAVNAPLFHRYRTAL